MMNKHNRGGKNHLMGSGAYTNRVRRTKPMRTKQMPAKRGGKRG